MSTGRGCPGERCNGRRNRSTVHERVGLTTAVGGRGRRARCRQSPDRFRDRLPGCPSGLSGLWCCNHAACARPAAPLLATPGLLPTRGVAALRCAARGLRRLPQDDVADDGAMGAPWIGLHRRFRDTGADVVPGPTGQSSGSTAALVGQATMAAHRVLGPAGARAQVLAWHASSSSSA
jgi:hypothetical protein